MGGADMRHDHENIRHIVPLILGPLPGRQNVPGSPGIFFREAAGGILQRKVLRTPWGNFPLVASRTNRPPRPIAGSFGGSNREP